MPILPSHAERVAQLARKDAAHFFVATPEAAVFAHTYGDIRVRVLRSNDHPDDWRVFIYETHGLSYGNPIWDSQNT